MSERGGASGSGQTWLLWTAMAAAAFVAGGAFGWGSRALLHAGEQLPEESRWKPGTKVVFVETPLFRKSLRDMLAASPATEAEWRRDIVERYHPNYYVPTAAVYSTPQMRPEPARLTLKDLSDNGQAHAIDFLAKQANAAWSRLVAAGGMDANTPSRDPYRADRVLIATVTPGMEARPGHRFSWTRVFVQPINFEFAGYTVAATDNRTVTVTSLESTKASKTVFGGELDAPEMAKPSASASTEQTGKATAEVSAQYENLGIDIQPKFLRIIRESAPGGDVAGNAAVQLSIVTDPRMIRRTWTGARDDPNRFADLALQVVDAQLTKGGNKTGGDTISVLPIDQLPHCPLKAVTWMLYEERTIDKGGENYLEGLQRVELIRDGEPKHTVDIVRADDISPAVWSIKVLPGKAPLLASSIVKGEDLFASTNESTPRKLVFTDYQRASEVVHWLKENPRLTKVGTLNFEKPKKLGEVTWDHVTLIPFKKAQDDCDPSGADEKSAPG